jgi:hypothetical protein
VPFVLEGPAVWDMHLYGADADEHDRRRIMVKC